MGLSTCLLIVSVCFLLMSNPIKLLKKKFLSCNCCILKKYFDKANDPNFAKSFFQKYM